MNMCQPVTSNLHRRRLRSAVRGDLIVPPTKTGPYSQGDAMGAYAPPPGQNGPRCWVLIITVSPQERLSPPTVEHSHTAPQPTWLKHVLISKATLNYSSQLQTWFSTRFAARFSTSSCGFATCFRLFLSKNLVANLLHQSGHVEIDAAGSLVRARARQMECRKKTVSSQPTNMSKLDFRYVFYYSCLSWRK